MLLSNIAAQVAAATNQVTHIVGGLFFDQKAVRPGQQNVELFGMSNTNVVVSVWSKNLTDALMDVPGQPGTYQIKPGWIAQTLRDGRTVIMEASKVGGNRPAPTSLEGLTKVG